MPIRSGSGHAFLSSRAKSCCSSETAFCLYWQVFRIGKGKTEVLLDSHFESVGRGEQTEGWTSHAGHMDDAKGIRN